MGNTLKTHLELAEKTGVCNLSGKNMSDFPDEMQRLSANLRTLDVSNNRLKHLPSYITSFGQLKKLNASNNSIALIPEDIGRNTKLETLEFSDNRLTSLPASISSLRNLKLVNLSGNYLKTFPMVLCELKSLNSLDLSRNRIAELPDDMSRLMVVELNLNNNQLVFITEKLADCPNLKVLRLDENRLQLQLFPVKILASSQIALFSVEGNAFNVKDFRQLEGYDKYMERYTATKKKFT